ncbi:MAG: LytTR family DNA-binding domain-containing protein [Bacteroidota bacterium]
MSRKTKSGWCASTRGLASATELASATTAFDQYALQAFKYSAIDYLLKPIDIDALVAAVEKVRRIKGISSYSDRYQLLKDMLASREINKIALTTQDGLHFVRYEDIIRLEASSNYTTFYLTNGSTLLITKTLGHYEELLLEKNFFRAHKSHLINLAYVRSFIKGKQGMVEMTDGVRIEVAVRKREALLRELASLN